jgi:hypothetical protein
MEDPVPAVAEAAARGETAAIFAEIRAVLGVGVVNLIWRHLATIPGALPWAWGLLRPRYADGTLAAVAAGLPGRLRLPAVPAMPASVPAAAGLGPADRRGIAGVLAAYERTNPLALVALAALSLRLEGGGPAAPAAPAPGVPAPGGGPLPLPPLLSAEAMGPEVVALIHGLNALGAAPRPDAVVATMYRHLAHWPPCLALAWAQLAPLHADGRLAAAIAECRAAARDLAAALPLPGPPPPGLPAESHAAVAGALDRFGAEVLPRMAVVCRLLRAAGWGGT